MKAWKHTTTSELYDIQTLPGPLPAEYDPEAWELTEVSAEELAAHFPPERESFLQRLNDDLHAYLAERGYDEGVQLSFQAIYTDLLEKTLTGQAKLKIRAAFDFVMGTVLPWYYARKTELENVTDYQSYTWDFHTLDEGDPCVTLREIMSLLT